MISWPFPAAPPHLHQASKHSYNLVMRRMMIPIVVPALLGRVAMMEAMIITSQDERWWAWLVVSLALCSHHHNKNCGSVMRAEARTKAQPTKTTTTSLTLGQSVIINMAPINSNCHQGGLLCPVFFWLSCSSQRRDRQTSNEQTDRTDRPRPLKSVGLNRHFKATCNNQLGRPTSSLSLNTNNRYLNQHHSADMDMNTQLLLPSTSPLFTKNLPATNISPFWVTNC